MTKPTKDEQEAQRRERVPNTRATPKFLATLTTCCLCGGPMPTGNRYLCVECCDAGLAVALTAYRRERGLRRARYEFAEADYLKGLRPR